MIPMHWLIGLLVVVYFIFDFLKFEKNPGEYSKKKRKFLRSPINPVASNAELFDAFGVKPELKQDDHDEAVNE